MDRKFSNSIKFNPRRYEGHLSLFGRKVLDTLIKKWTSGQNRSINQHLSYQLRMPPPLSHWPRTKKVLTFITEKSQRPQLPQPPPMACIEIPNENNEIDKPFNFNDVQEIKPPIPSTSELFKTVEQTTNRTEVDIDIIISNKRIEGMNHSTYDMVYPVNDGNKSRNILYEFSNRFDDIENISINFKDTARNDNEFAAVTRPRVNWEDMFDTELLPVATDAKLMIQQNAIAEATNDQNHETYDSKPTKTKINKPNDVLKTKRKIQPKVTEAIQRKVKRISKKEKPQNNFRKQKYTKTVNDWLEDVNPNNSVAEEDTGMTDIVEIADTTYPTAFDKNKDKANKKVIQAQLANKNGKMKFGKPKIDTEASAVKSDNDIFDKPTDKKTKPKFIAPIKSQIPVKEVQYEVVFVNSTSMQGNNMECLLVEKQNVIIVLIYSNGFCQLNKQHTEDSCEPEGFMFHVDEKFYYFKGACQSFKEIIKFVLQNNRIICFEGKHLLIYFKSQFNLEFFDLNMIDAKIGGSLLNPDNPPETFSGVQNLLSFTPQYTIATECTQQKTAWYITLLDECSVKLTTALKENGLWSVFVEIEMQLVPIIAEMERRGVTVDLEKLKSMEDVLLTKMKEVEQECYKAAGKTFQLNSAAQIRTIIYDDLQLDTKCNVKIKETIGKGAKSTSEIMLRSLVSVHPLPKLILEYRHLHKAYSTFLIGIAQQVKDGIVRPTWVQTAAATGRIASKNPNLQAIPKAPFSLILFPDDNHSDNQTLSIRSVYTSRVGYSLVAADFQHVECRVFAHCASDMSLTHSLQAGGDLFRALAAKWLNKSESDISSEDRERTKRIVYASLYGAGCRKLMDILAVSYEQVLSIMASFNRTFPSLKSFGKSVVSRCEQNGGRLSTLCGRGRRFRNIASPDCQLRSQAERQAVNFLVQGSAADLCKMAMVLTTRRLRSHSPPIDGCLLIQIHDELVWEIRDEHVNAAAAIIQEEMEGCGRGRGLARLPAALGAGRAWGRMAPHPAPRTPHITD